MEDSAAEAPGRKARRPTEMGRAAWKMVLVRVWQGIATDHLSIIAAGVAFFGILAIFPAIAALIAAYGFVADPHHVAETLEAARPLLPAEVFAAIEGQVDALLAAPQAKLGVASLVSFALVLWSARAGVSALMEGMNVVYREVDTRSIVVQYLISLALTLAFIAVEIVALFAVVAVPTVLNFTSIGVVGQTLARVAPLAILGAAIVFIIGALYRYAPRRAPARKRWITVGAVMAAVGWLAVSVALSAYFARFPDFNRTYGSLGAIVGLLFWLYASTFVVLLGAELNAQLELQTEMDTTTGRPRPMGDRGAYVADHVA
ncbi:MAG: YihY/virulence factor BrkB family protein [Amaricoccus sp.]|uniref:YihY/virulence factor BrkB family protein n=1 Tax=Amaricoccus sp. TaxID=1872485 RepID=UPI0039E31357